MPSSLTINNIIPQFTARLINGQFILNETSLIPTNAQNLIDFVNSLPQQLLMLGNAQISVSSESLPTTFTLTGQVNKSLPITGLKNQTIQINKASVIISQLAITTPINSQLILEGILKIGGKEMAVVGNVTPTGEVLFSLNAITPKGLSLATISDFMSATPLPLYLPADLNIFNSVTLNNLAVQFSLNLDKEAHISVATTVGIDLNWQIIAGLIELRNIQLSLQISQSFLNKISFYSSFNGSIQALTTIGQDFAVRLAFQGRNFWELEVIPSQGNILPGLATLANLAGGAALNQLINKGLADLGLGSITINDVRFGVDLAPKRLNYVSIKGGLTVIGVPLDISVFLPDFQISGAMARNTKISLKTFIAKYFSAADNFPEVDITEFSFFAYPKQTFYRISVTITDDWKFEAINFALSRVSVDLNKASTGVTASISAALTIAGVDIIIAGNNAQTGSGWLIEGSTAPGETIPVIELITKFLPDQWSSYVPASLKALELHDIYAAINTKTKAYNFRASLDWQLNELDFKPTFSASLAINYNPTATPIYSGAVTGYFAISSFQIQVGYAFADKNTTLTFGVTFQDISLDCILIKQPTTDTLLRAHISNLSLGQIVAELVHLADPNATFLTDSPWDELKSFLDSIKSDNLYLDFNLTKKTAGIEYNLNKDFFSIDGLPPLLHIDTIKLAQLNRGGSTTVDISITGRFFEQTYSDSNPLRWDLLNDKPPITLNRNKLLLQVEYLGLGQHVALDTTNITTMAQAIDALEVAAQPVEDTSRNPLNQLSKLHFSKDSHWLIGAKLTVMETVALSVVFNDPVLYGLHVGLQGNLAKSLAGLEFEILYRKVTSTIGVYHTEIKLPDQMRRIEMGAMTIILPVIALDIYTNGNFKVDFGFPTNRDFSRSCGLELLPFVGYGGFYFALLSGETSHRVPQISNGRFDPVIEFGLGLSVGVGKTIERGPLKAGLTVTVEGILEGVIGWFQPDSPTVARDRYYWIQGTIAIVGQLYGEVDFKIIQVSVSVVVYASVTLVAEAYQPIIISISAGVSVSAKIKILFITIRFSFSFTLNTSFTIGSASPTPWQLAPTTYAAARAMALPAKKAMSLKAMSLMATASVPNPWTPIRFFDKVQPIKLTLLPAFTVGLPESPGLPLGSAAKFKTVLLLTAENSLTSGGNIKPFNLLVEGILKWSIYALKQDLTTVITADELKEIYRHLSDDEIIDTAFTYANISQFLAQNYQFYIGGWDSQVVDSTIFPMLPALAYTPGTNPKIDFTEHNKVDADYDQKLAAYFQQLTVDPQYNTAINPLDATMVTTLNPLNDNKESLATVIFRDYFLMLAKTAVQHAIDQLSDAAISSIAIPTLLTNMISSYNNIAAMISRFLLHGLRLPNPYNAIWQALSVAEIKRSFLDQKGLDIDFYPLYELTGQQFIAPDITATDFPINFTKSGSVDWVKFATSYITIATDTMESICKSTSISQETLFALNPTLASLPDPTKPLLVGTNLLLPTNATTLNLKLTNQLLKDHYPSVTFQPQNLAIQGLPLTQNIKVRYSLTTNFTWQSGEMLQLAYNKPAVRSSLGLWWFSDALFSRTNNSTNPIKYQLATINRNDKPTVLPQAVNNYAWATALEVKVQALPSEQTKGLLPNTYLMLGCDEADQQLLQKLWNYLKSNSNDNLTLYFLYEADTSKGKASPLVSDSINRDLSFLLKTNLATLTPTEAVTKGYVGSLTKTQSRDFIKLLWEASLVGTGGFYWQYLNTVANKGLPAEIFTANNEATLWLVMLLDSQCQEKDALQNVEATNKTVYNFNNCAITSSSFDLTKQNLFVEAADDSDTTKLTTLPPGNIGFQVKRTNPEDQPESEIQRTEALYHLVGYHIEPNNYFLGTNENLPLGPTQQDATNLSLTKTNNDNQYWYYNQALPIFRLAKRSPLPELKGLPAAKQDPYAGIASDAQAQFKLAFHDVYGNRLSATDLPLPLDIRYFDNIIGLAQWPGTAAHYQFTLANNHPLLTIDLNLDITKYAPSTSNSYEQALYNASAHQKKYEQIYYQINQNALNFSLRTTLDKSTNAWPTEYPLAKVKLTNFVSAVYIFLSAITALKPYCHTVALAETLAGVAQIYTVTPLALIRANEYIDSSNKLAVTNLFEQIKISDTNSYTPTTTETFTDITAKFGISFEDLVRFNLATKFKAGVRLKIPALTVIESPNNLYAAYLPKDSDNLSISSLPLVVANKSLAQHATQYNVSVVDLAIVNSSLDNFIQKAVVLIIKRVDPATNQPIIKQLTSKPHDTFNSLVGRFQQEQNLLTTIEELVLNNQDNPQLLNGGTAFMLPPFLAEVSTLIKPNYSDTIFPILVGLEMVRDRDLVYPQLRNEEGTEFKNITGVMKDCTLIVAKQSHTTDGKLSLNEFAQNFETAFSSQLKVAVGRSEQASATTRHLWAINFGTGGIEHLQIKKAQPQFFALRPLANRPISKTNVLIHDYSSTEGLVAQGRYQNFQAIDLEVWMRNFLAAIDLLLSPQYAVAAYQQASADYQRIVAAKATLAQAIAAGVEYLFVDDNQPNNAQIALTTAQEALYQQLLISLGNAYNVDVIIQYPVDISLGAAVQTQPINLVGNLVTTAANIPANSKFVPNYTFSPGKTALANGTSLLTTMFNTNLESIYKHLSLTLDYVINELEYNISPLTDIDGYQASSWLSLVIPISSQAVMPAIDATIGEVDIPVLLRAYPTPPVIIGQSGTATYPDATSVETAKLWDYTFNYQHQEAAQDVEYLLFSFNSQKHLMQSQDANQAGLFDPLAQFDAIYPSLKKDLALLLQTPSDANSAIIATAIKVFADLVTNIATVWKYDFNSTTSLNLPEQTYLYRVAAQINEADDSLQNLTLTALPGTDLNAIVWPTISLEKDSQYLTLTAGSPQDLQVSYHSSSKFDASIPLREKFSFKNLDIVSIQNASAGIYLQRNENLINGKITNSDFIYQTPLITVPNSLTPFIEQNNTIDISYDKDPNRALKVLWAKLFDINHSIQTYVIKLICQYGYELVIAIPATLDSKSLSSIISRLPVLFHPKFTLEVDYTPTPTTKPQDLFINQLVNAIQQWQRKNVVAIQGGSYLFEIGLYSTLDKELIQPILQVKSLQYKINN